MQEILVLILVVVAGVYAFRRVKRALTVGEGEAQKCAGCPVNPSNLRKQKNMGHRVNNV